MLRNIAIVCGLLLMLSLAWFTVPRMVEGQSAAIFYPARIYQRTVNATSTYARLVSDDWGLFLATTSTSTLSHGAISGSIFHASSTTATSTFNNGLRLYGGCFAGSDGLCITSGGGAGVTTYLALTDTPGSFTASAIPYTNTGATALLHSGSFVFDGTNFGVGTSTPSTNLSIQGNALIAGTSTVSGIRATSTFQLRDDVINDLTGTGLTITGGALGTSLGTAIEAAEMANADFGDWSCDGAGSCTVDANAIALGTDTTGGYVATIADSGNSTVTVVGSGSETAAVTLNVIDLNCTDCIGATEITDVYLLNNADDSTTGLLTAAGGFIGQASSTITGAINVQTVQASSTATSTFVGGIAAQKYSATATSTFVGLSVETGGLRIDTLKSCTGSGVLETDANGAIVCGTDDNTGGGGGVDVAQKSKWATSTADATAIYTALADKIGIASSTPSTNLSVQGDAHISGTSTIGGLRATTTIRLRDEEVQSWSGTGLSITGGILNVPAGTCITANANDIAVTTNCTDATTLDSIDSGSFLRSDASDSYTSGTLTFDAGTSLDLNTTTLTIADTGIGFDGASTDFAFTGNWTANTNQLSLLKASGFFGVATVTPSTVLSVQGGMLISGTTTMAGIISTSTVYAGNIITTSTSTLIGLTVNTGGLKVANLTSCSTELETDSAGNVFCGTSSAGSAAGADTQLQYNDGGSAFGGATGLIWDDIGLLFGVGSTTPRQVLSVQGNALISGTTTVGVLSATSTLILNLAVDPSGTLRVPFNASPTMVPGNLALDTTDNQLIMATGTPGAVVYARDVKRLYSFTVGTTTATTIDPNKIPLPTEKDGMTILYARCWVWGGTSVVISIADESNNVTSNVTCTTASTTDQQFGSANRTFTAGEGAEVRIGTITGTVYKLGVALYGVITSE